MSELTRVQTEFIKILKSFMRDGAYRCPDDFSEMEELFQMSRKHHMTAAVFEQLRKDDIWKKPENQRLFSAWKRETLRDVMTQMQRTEGFLAVYEMLCEAGVKPLVVKGLVCRNMYSKPDYRVSGDEDILIRREDFEVCDRILLREGFTRTALEGDGTEDLSTGETLPYEIPYINPQNGVYIELHFSLFPEESGAYGHLNEEFTQVFEHGICREIQGKEIWTLCPTEHLFYLICHSFKHFLHSGFGMRQVCDMVLMAEKDGAQIDWHDVRERLERLNMKTYWDALIQIGERYFGFSGEKAGYLEDMYDREVDCSALLTDLLDSGVYGNSSMERKHSSNMTLAAAAGGKANTANSLKASLFPGKEYMKESFPWLKKSPWLLPAAYGIRIVRYLRTSVKKKTDQNSVQIGIERVDLLKQYRIIE